MNKSPFLSNDENVIWQGCSNLPALTMREVLLYYMPSVVLSLVLLLFYIEYPVEYTYLDEFYVFLRYNNFVQVILIVLTIGLAFRPVIKRITHKYIMYCFTTKRAFIYKKNTYIILFEVKVSEIQMLSCTRHTNGYISLWKEEVTETSDGNNFITREGFEYVPSFILSHYKEIL